MKLLKSLAAAAAMVALSGTAQAALVLQSNGLEVLDTRTNLIWLQNWNVNGLGNWGAQNTWAQTLSFAGSNDWRLPEISEYSAILNAYGNLTQVTQFTNVQFATYWSGTQSTPGIVAWTFGPNDGGPGSAGQVNQFFAVAVRPIPEPQTYAMLLAGLGAVLVAVRRRRATRTA